MNPLSLWTNFKSQLDSYVGVLGRRFLALIWVGAICAVIWIFGPRLDIQGWAPLVSQRNRIIAIATVITVWLLWTLISWLRSRRADRALEDEAVQSPEALESAESQAELAELKSRLKNAMKLMRKVTRKRVGAAYEFPWYLMMGAPGAGKTTLLTKSGLKFPLGDADGAEPVQGVGGTKNCNWWFTDRAILIDTAGRFTTQDSNSERDKKSFLGFLSMIQKHRRAQPINGVIMTLSLTDLLTQDPEERLREVRAIRQRLAEIETTLNARVPIYLVLTKADRLIGFGQFFEDLGGQSREQVWGMTFDYEASKKPGSIPEQFSTEYRNLQTRLSGLLLERLQQEQDIQRRGAIFRFPAQIAALHDAMREIIEELASGTGSVQEPMLRGVYFASATQDALSLRAMGAPAQSMNRSYFVSRLFSDVILGEANLIANDQRVSRRGKIARVVGYGALAACCVALSGSWITSYLFNQNALKQVNGSLTSFVQRVDTVPVEEIAEKDFLRILPALDALQDTPTAFTSDGATAPIHEIGFGLGQERRIVEQHATSYDDALGAYLLPRYMVALQDRLKTADLSTPETFETLKHYLSLAGFGPIDSDALLVQANLVFDDLYAGPGRKPTRDSLMEHMRNMLERGNLPVLEIDEALVAEARAKIEKISPAQRALDLVATRDEAQQLPDWSPEQALGPVAASAFTRTSGASFGERIEGIYTRLGYQTVIVPQFGQMAEVAAQEDWVRGPTAVQAGTVSDISRDAMQLYWTEFSKQWRDLVTDIRLRDAPTLVDAADLISLLASDADPLGRLSNEIVENSHLTAIGPVNAFVDTSAMAFDPLAAPEPFRTLRLALEAGSEEEPNEIEALVPTLDEIYLQLNRVTATDSRASEVFIAESQLNTSMQALVASGRALPTPVDVWIVQFASSLANKTMVRARQEASNLWTAGPASQCTRAVNGRYPFERDQSRDVTLEDFTRIFGPGGVFETFFEDNLASFVDRSVNPWVWRGGLGTQGESSEALQQFQRAQDIQTAFFPGAATRPEVTLTFDLLNLDEPATGALVDIGGERSVHGIQAAPRKTLEWPGDERQTATLRLLPISNATSVIRPGEWGAFRLIDAAEITETSENQLNAVFDLAGTEARFRITIGSVNNPLTLDAISTFACPPDLLD